MKCSTLDKSVPYHQPQITSAGESFALMAASLCLGFVHAPSMQQKHAELCVVGCADSRVYIPPTPSYPF